MTDLSTIKFVDLLPPNLKTDTDAIAAGAALDGQFSVFVNNIGKVIIFPNINNLTEDVLDLLALELHVDFYNTTLAINTKRSLVQNSLIWHRKKGTPAVVEEPATTIFGGGELQEWFDYGGEPYHFKIAIKLIDKEYNSETFNNFLNMIAEYKNVRSILDEISIESQFTMNPNCFSYTDAENEVIIG